ncbi:MAG: nitrophenyl compound nitroreductase subunit ArsF family protein [Bacteroidetes bacterium]|nr:nitrophenyl compound nitroreductase subunit ArsF family protein [Bacteroidota bacterium]
MNTKKILIFASIILLFAACNNSSNKSENNQADTYKAAKSDSTEIKDTAVQTASASQNPDAKQAVVMIYNFHVTNRCASCIAIEEATTKTLNTYFANEVKQGRIKRQILNVDDKANNKISEKYQAFGSGLFITRIFQGKETTTDMTGDGFKFARNKEERFIELLKFQIKEYLK